jgi:hypothetical protein
VVTNVLGLGIYVAAARRRAGGRVTP